MPGLPAGMEWVIIALVALLLFGGSRLAGIGKSAGRAIREFKEETKPVKDQDAQPTVTPEPPTTGATQGTEPQPDPTNDN